jgi:hypothetical protein
MNYKNFSMRKFQKNKKKFNTVRSRYYERLYNEPPDIMNNFWLFSGSTSIEITLKNCRYNEQLDIMNGFGLHSVSS